MRYLARLSMYGPRSGMNFWNQWDATELWLASIRKEPSERRLGVRAKGLGPLSPWLEEDGADLRYLEGWTHPVSVSTCWKYLDTFGTGILQSLRVPCGNEIWVDFIPKRMIRISAPESGWIWHGLKDVLNDLVQAPLDRQEWRERGRQQTASRYAWGFVVAGCPRPGWREWTMRAEPAGSPELTAVWTQLAEQLGWRSIAVGWRPGHGGFSRAGLGIDVRVNQAHLQIDASMASPACRRRPLRGINIEATWTFPDWGGSWSAELRLVKATLPYPRLEAWFTPLNAQAEERFLRMESRRLPILELLPLSFAESVKQGPWSDVAEWITWHEHAQSAIRACQNFAGADIRDKPGRLPRGWSYSRLESAHGRWVIRHQRRPISVQLSWPEAVHPGHISVNMGGVVHLDLDDLDPSGLVDRWEQRPQYWHSTIERLLDRLGAWIESHEGIGHSS